MRAGGAVSVAADETLLPSLALDGQGTAAFGVSVGASVAVVDINSVVQAFVQDGTTIGAGGDVAVSASFTDNVTAQAYAGSLGAGVDAAGQAAAIADNATESATLGNVRVTRANSLTVRASANRALEADAAGGSAAVGLAAGAAIGQAFAHGSTTASVGGPVGQAAGKSVGDVAVSATSTDSATVNSHAIAVGIGAGEGNDALATVDPAVSATVGNNVLLTSTGSVSVTAMESSPSASANTFGVAVGGITVGHSQSEATVAPTIQATVGQGAHVTGGNGTVAVQAARTGASATTSATASGGGVAASGSGAVATSTLSATVGASLGQNAVVATGLGGDVTVTANSSGTATGTASATNLGGLVAAGKNEADAIVTGATTAEVGAGATVTAGRDISVAASSTQNTSTNVSAGASTLGIGAARTTATASRNDPVSALVDDGTRLTAVRDVSVMANNGTAQTSSEATNGALGLVAGIGNPEATSTINDSTTAQVGNNAVVTATGGSFTLQAVTNDTGVESKAPGWGGGFVGVANATATSSVTDPATAQIGTSTQVTAGTDILIESTENSHAHSNAADVAGGAGAHASSTATTTCAAQTKKCHAPVSAL